MNLFYTLFVCFYYLISPFHFLLESDFLLGRRFFFTVGRLRAPMPLLVHLVGMVFFHD